MLIYDDADPIVMDFVVNELLNSANNDNNKLNYKDLHRILLSKGHNRPTNLH